MTKKDSLSQDEPKPVEEITQADKQDAEGEAGKAASPPVVQSVNPEVDEPNPAESEEETDRKQDEAIASLAEKTDWIAKQTQWMKWQVIASSFMGAVTLGILVYHGVLMGRQSEAMKEQTGIMQGQLRSMESDSAQTQEMIDATQRMANASQATAEQNRELVAHAGKQAEASLAQAEAAEQSVGAAQASARAAEKGAQIAQESFYVGDRPYVFAGYMMIEKFEAGVKPKITVVFSNTGKTPALDFKFAAKASISPEPSPKKDMPRHGVVFEPTLPNFPGSISTLPAGERMGAPIEREVTLDKTTIEEIKSRKKFLFVYGLAFYKDGLGKPHELRFCSFYIPSEDMFAPCSEFNSTK
jgi:hypothetical protein